MPKFKINNNNKKIIIKEKMIIANLKFLKNSFLDNPPNATRGTSSAARASTFYTTHTTNIKINPNNTRQYLKH